MFVGDEAECRDIELVDLVNYISHSGSLFEEQAVRVTHYLFLLHSLRGAVIVHSSIRLGLGKHAT